MMLLIPRCVTFVVALCLFSLIVKGQTVEVQGNLRITGIDTISSGDTLVLVNPDGTLVIRSAADVLDEVSLDNKIIQYFLTLPEGMSALLDIGDLGKFQWALLFFLAGE